VGRQEAFLREGLLSVDSVPRLGMWECDFGGVVVLQLLHRHVV
jgi:hypothetical protein